ncbi:MAG: hypothetical protein NT074_00920 [Methanomicrobiales archaeon]|jgi:hypothetical protein|nr:hypothetical protein [Methanomicrobiales archaeon]
MEKKQDQNGFGKRVVSFFGNEANEVEALGPSPYSAPVRTEVDDDLYSVIKGIKKYAREHRMNISDVLHMVEMQFEEDEAAPEQPRGKRIRSPLSEPGLL